MQELESLLSIIPCDVKVSSRPSNWRISNTKKGGPDTKQGKVNILLQGYISQLPVDDFALISDTAYAAQNGSRIARALLEIAISRKWASVTAVIMGICKAIEKRMWPFAQPLRQFPLKNDVLYNLETWADDWPPSELAKMPAGDIGKLIHMSERQGQAILNAAQQFPTVSMRHSLRPLSFDALKISVNVHRTFKWNNQVHGSSEPFWIWVEEGEGLYILQMAYLTFRPDIEDLRVDFVIPFSPQSSESHLSLRYVSERWMGGEDEVQISFESLVMPSASSHAHNAIHDLPLLPTSILRNQLLENALTRVLTNFNGLQIQVIWSLLHTRSSILYCAPAGSGKTVLSAITAWLDALE